VAVNRGIFFITGTDTGVGKTVLTCLLSRYLRASAITAAALKPICSGERGDAILLHKALNGALNLDEINPWHFPAPLAPLLAARRVRRKVLLREVLNHVRRIQRRFPVVLVEGAGGLLSPLGEDFDSRDLINQLRALPIVVCPNRLGAINHARLALAALPAALSKRAQVVLMAPQRADPVSRTNAGLLKEFFGRQRVHEIPWLKLSSERDKVAGDRRVRQTMKRLLDRR
jgi:dethiobiotin synthetase